MLIAEARTGSTSIGKYFEAVMPKYKVFLEPFNELKTPPYEYRKVLNYENVFIKQLYIQIPKEYSNVSRLEFYNMVFNDFDKVIFLSRKDQEKQTESFSAALVNDNWHKSYMFDKEKDKEKYEISLNHIRGVKNEITNIATEKQAKIFYYEDLFYNKENMVNFLSEIDCVFNENIYEMFLGLEKKYRSEKTSKTII